MSDMLTGKTVLVTGAATGIGRAIAQEAARNGASLVLGDIALEALSETAGELEADGAKVVYSMCDVQSQDDLDALVSSAVSNFSLPDIVYANAGFEGPMGSPADYSEDEFTKVIDVNLNGIWRTMKAVLPGMMDRASGSIVATASVAGLVGAGGLPAYVASKHGVVGLVKSTAITVAKAGIRVNALCPGMVDTAMLDRLCDAEPTLREGLLALKPMGRMGTPEEIARAAIWLGSDQVNFITGHTLAVDGGYVAQ